ncbi:MAG: phosphatase PAP2 family protein [Patescibacteria group bacterium]|nr:phosphatase PAP2 family protein [Patescibacteria group bacterium]
MPGAKRTFLAHAISMLASWWGIICSVVLVYLIHPIPINKAYGFIIWVLAPTLAGEAVKFIFRRPRPVMRGEPVKVKTYGYSFPSSHTVAATMVASWILIVPEIRWWSWLFLLWPLIVGWSRVWLRAHDQIDVWGGIIFGAVCAYLFLLFGLV